MDSNGVRAKYQEVEGATEILSIIPWTLVGADMELAKIAIAPVDKPPPKENGDDCTGH